METSLRQKTAAGMPIIHISQALYAEIAAELKDCVLGRSEYNGKISYEGRAFAGVLNIWCVVYYEVIDYPEGRVDQIKDIVPIWAEFNTYFTEDEDGESYPNDFQFSEVRKYLS